MAVQTYVLADLTSPAPANRLFKAYICESHHVMTKALPNYVKSIEIEGNPYQVGCIKRSNLPEGSGPFTCIKSVLEALDVENMYAKLTTIEGDVLEDKWERIEIEHKFKPSGSGSHYLMTGHYFPKGDYVMKEEEITQIREFVKRNTACISEYLLANPQVCA